MNDIVKEFLLTADNFMPEFHLKQLGITYNACGSFNKHRGMIKNRSFNIYVYTWRDGEKESDIAYVCAWVRACVCVRVR